MDNYSAADAFYDLATESDDNEVENDDDDVDYQPGQTNNKRTASHSAVKKGKTNSVGSPKSKKAKFSAGKVVNKDRASDVNGNTTPKTSKRAKSKQMTDNNSTNSTPTNNSDDRRRRRSKASVYSPVNDGGKNASASFPVVQDADESFSLDESNFLGSMHHTVQLGAHKYTLKQTLSGQRTAWICQKYKMVCHFSQSNFSVKYFYCGRMLVQLQPESEHARPFPFLYRKKVGSFFEVGTREPYKFETKRRARGNPFQKIRKICSDSSVFIQKSAILYRIYSIFRVLTKRLFNHFFGKIALQAV